MDDQRCRRADAQGYQIAPEEIIRYILGKLR